MKHPISTTVQCVIATLFSVLVAGCGFNTSLDSSSISTSPLNGMIHGGPNPIVGATVTLYETQVGASSTYGSAGKVLATTTSGSYGQFTFTTGYTCDTAPYMQYAYIGVTGGNTGANSVNNNEVLMAALGPCSDLANPVSQAATTIYVSEATTTAAAYALSNFLNVSGTTGSQVINIGATPANDATLPACTGSGGTLTCTAGGLGHAFATAVALANGVSYNGGTAPTGLFNTSMPGYTGSEIPQAMLNVVAAALQACVNSSGGAAGDSPADNCGTLFTDTTAGGVTPSDTLTAAINIAKYPSTSTAVGSAGIFSLVTPTSYFVPALSAPPTDYTLGVFYPGSTDFPYAWSLALDIADNVYVMAANGDATAAVTQSGIAAIGYNAQGQTSLLYGYSGNASTSFLIPGFLAVDSNSNVYASNPGASGSNKIREFTGATGASVATISPVVGATAIPYGSGLAIDRSNNLWMATLNTSSNKPAIYQVPPTGSITNYSGTVTAVMGSFNGITIDANQNVWSCAAGNANNASQTVAFPNTGGTANSTLYKAANTTGAVGFAGGGAAIDSLGDVYCPFKSAITQAVPNASVVSANPTVYSTVTNPTTPANDTGIEVDSNGTIFQTGDALTSVLFVLPTTGSGSGFAGTPYRLDPCYPLSSPGNSNVGAGIYCSDNSSAFSTTATPPSTPLSLMGLGTWLQIDSMGSIWSSVGTSINNTISSPAGIVQIIGPAAPVWPLLSYGKPGLKP